MSWTTRLQARLRLERTAKSEHEKAQDALEKARRADLHPRQRLVLARDRAADKLTLRRKQVAEARRHVKVPVAEPHVEISRSSPNCSSRNGSRPRRIVLHITVSHNRPGLSDLRGMVDYLCRRDVQASSHIINDAEGHDARIVPDHLKAWTQAAYNPDSLSIEQIEYSDKRTRAEWLSGNKAQLDNTAKWIAYWSVKFGIPITHSVKHGVCGHQELGRAGGGHSDPGAGYPLDYVLEKARKIKAGS
jgi:hypothetical protein